MKRVCTNHTVQDKNALLFLNNKIDSCKLRVLSISILLACVFTEKAAFAQHNNLLDKKITLELQDVVIPTVLDAIGAQAGCTFSYSSTLIDINKKVSVNYRDIAVREALSQLIGSSLKKLYVHDNIVDIQIHGSKGKIKGKITDPKGQPVPFASIGLKGTTHASMADADGNYEIHAHEGDYILLAQLTGYDNYEAPVKVTSSKTTDYTISMQAEASKELDEVMIVGKSEAQQVRETSFSVTSIDAKPLHNTSQDINQVLNKTAGVRIREDGGLGSTFNFALNGFSGNQVKFFIDGIPMDNFGPSLTLNNIPINMADRIEVYKGVVPIWLGSDALGGAVNIVTNSKIRNFLDASYSYGSFNTHRTSINTGYTHQKTGFTVLASFFQNYSDNNYWVNVPIVDLVNAKVGPRQRVRRFHDTYRSETFQLEAGLTGKKYADKLLFGIILSQNQKDIQTAAQMTKVYGKRMQNSNTIMPTFKYKKSDLFIKGLELNLYGAYNLGSTQNIDTVNRVYNWLGQYKDNSYSTDGSYSPGGEESRNYYKFRNNLVIGTANLIYTISKRHSLGLNYVISSFNRKGSDELKPDEEAYTKPQILKKQTIGFGYKFDLNNRLSTSVFVKRYIVTSENAQRVDIYTNPRYVTTKTTMPQNGYGIAASYFVFTWLQLKASFENTYRMPDGDEMYGDGVNQVANKNLKPEQSNNLNIGFIFNKLFFNKHRFTFESNFIYRNASDFIRTDATGMSMQAVNVRGVKNTGFDTDFKYSYKNLFNIGGNLTYQHMINTAMFEPTSTLVSPVYLDQIPNIPYLFGNINTGLNFRNAGFKHASLGISYSLVYVEEYYLKWPSLGGSRDKNTIDQQVSHNISATYSLKDGKYNISLECRNFTDSQLYDNFELQKPGRAFYVKLRYFIKK